jgi:hypothetical protein
MIEIRNHKGMNGGWIESDMVDIRIIENLGITSTQQSKASIYQFRKGEPARKESEWNFQYYGGSHQRALEAHLLVIAKCLYLRI